MTQRRLDDRDPVTHGDPALRMKSVGQALDCKLVALRARAGHANGLLAELGEETVRRVVVG